MGGRAAFFIGSLRAMATYENAPVAVTLDGEKWFEGRVVNVAVANGQYFGGGMRIAPEADPSDGRFDVVAIGDLTLGESLGLSKRLYSGKHLGMPKVRHERASRVEARPLGTRPVLIDLDGEAPGRLPLRARIAAGALRLRV
jgi:diacylglycerol kinase family enzyme